MTFFLLDDPSKPSQFARFSHVGTWSEGSVCKKCGELVGGLLMEPLQIEWNEGTDRIGDFSWCGYTCVVNDAVKDFLEGVFSECSFGKVEIHPPETKSKRPRVPYPYDGPKLHWLRPTRQLLLDEARSGVEQTPACKFCSQKRYTFKREGLAIERGLGANAQIFLIEQYMKSGAIFVTEQLLGLLTDRGFSNLCPRLAGRID